MSENASFIIGSRMEEYNESYESTWLIMAFLIGFTQN